MAAEAALAPLADVRVLALEQFGAGPWATAQLADLGAEVIKVERAGEGGGDVGRWIPPYQSGEDSLFFETFNKGKRSICLDLDDPKGQAAFRRIAGNCDAVFSNLRGDTPERLGLTYAALSEVNRKIVCCSLSGFGMTGPRATEPVYDPVIQAMTGWMSVTGEPSGPPTRTGLSLVDFAGGYAAALALCIGVHQARRDGVGLDCDVSLFETGLSLLTYLATWSASAGHVAQRMPHSSHASLVPFQAFPTSDSWVVVACAKEKFWQRLCAAIDRQSLADDPRFATFALRSENRDAVLAELEATISTWSTADLVARLGEAGVPCAAVNDIGEALTDPQVEARQGLVDYEHPRLGRVVQARSAVRVGDHREPPRPAPSRGADSRQVLTELGGYSERQFEALVAQGVTGAAAGLERDGVA